LDDQPVVVEDLKYENSQDNFSPLKSKVEVADALYNLSSFNVTNMAQSPLGYAKKIAGPKVTDKKMS
jgi:hypothetical protein